MKPIAEFEVIDHGIEHAQYFQGCGTSYTKFANVVTGCGESAAEAWDDALECIAMDGFDVSTIEQSEDNALFTSDKADEASVENHLAKAGIELGENEDCELYYYVSIRWNGKVAEDSETVA